MRTAAKILICISVVTLTIKASNEGSSYTNSYADCVNLIHNFDYTYNLNGANTLDAFPYGNGENALHELVTCNFAGMCPDGIARSSCSW